MHTYHYTRVQEEDYPRRRRFCKNFLRKVDENPEFHSRVIFSDASRSHERELLIRTTCICGEIKILELLDLEIFKFDGKRTSGQESWVRTYWIQLFCQAHIRTFWQKIFQIFWKKYH